MIAELVVLTLFAGLVLYHIRQIGAANTTKQVAEHTANPQTEQALAYASRLYAENKYLAAEKAYLAVLKHDHKNHVAYTRLGKIYTVLKNFPDAIECYRIASQLSPNAHSYFNLGAGYYENKNYIKAVAAFEKAIMFEPSAVRYSALARAHQKLSNWPKVINALEKAVDLQPDRVHLQALYDALRSSRRLDEASVVQKRMQAVSETVSSRTQTLS